MRLKVRYVRIRDCASERLPHIPLPRVTIQTRKLKLPYPYRNLTVRHSSFIGSEIRFVFSTCAYHIANVAITTLPVVLPRLTYENVCFTWTNISYRNPAIIYCSNLE
jgi:hypothetical protein